MRLQLASQLHIETIYAPEKKLADNRPLHKVVNRVGTGMVEANGKFVPSNTAGYGVGILDRRELTACGIMDKDVSQRGAEVDTVGVVFVPAENRIAQLKPVFGKQGIADAVDSIGGVGRVKSWNDAALQTPRQRHHLKNRVHHSLLNKQVYFDRDRLQQDFAPVGIGSKMLVKGD